MKEVLRGLDFAGVVFWWFHSPSSHPCSSSSLACRWLSWWCVEGNNCGARSSGRDAGPERRRKPQREGRGEPEALGGTCGPVMLLLPAHIYRAWKQRVVPAVSQAELEDGAVSWKENEAEWTRGAALLDVLCAETALLHNSGSLDAVVRVLAFRSRYQIIPSATVCRSGLFEDLPVAFPLSSLWFFVSLIVVLQAVEAAASVTGAAGAAAAVVASAAAEEAVAAVVSQVEAAVSPTIRALPSLWSSSATSCTHARGSSSADAPTRRSLTSTRSLTWRTRRPSARSTRSSGPSTRW